MWFLEVASGSPRFPDPLSYRVLPWNPRPGGRPGYFMKNELEDRGEGGRVLNQQVSILKLFLEQKLHFKNTCYLLVKTARFPPLCGGGDPPLDDSDMDVSQTTYQVQCCPMWGKLAEGKLPFSPWLVLTRTPKGPYYGVARYCMTKNS